MELNVITETGQENKMTISPENFNVEFNEALVHQVVTAYLASGRAGTKAQKNRSDVRGGGKKPWRQKGTGRARVGSIRSPIWRTGGVTFAARPKSYEQKVNRKMYRGALRSILSELLRQDRLTVIDEIKLEHPKTSDLIKKLENFKITESVLIVTKEIELNLELAGRNVHRIGICLSSELSPVNLIQYEKIVMTKDALNQIEERLV